MTPEIPSTPRVGPAVPDWTGCPRPPRTELRGRYCSVQGLDPDRHAAELFTANREDADGHLWTYLGYGPFETLESYRQWMDRDCRGEDPLFHAVIDHADGRAAGVASLMRIEPSHGVVEVGHINFAPRLQRTRAGTEALFLLMRRVFDELGYRRCEWKCDALNRASRRAADRLGFRYEGTFRQALVYKGRNRDTAWYAITDREWPALRGAFEAWLDPANFDDRGRQRQRLTTLTRPASAEPEAAPLLRQAGEAAIEYLSGVRERAVYPDPDALEALRVFDEDLPEESEEASTVIERLQTFGSPATVASGGGRYFGFVVGGALPVTLAAKWLSTVWDQNPALALLSPVTSRLETVCERWLPELLGLPSGSEVGYVSGASEANLVALAAARHHLLQREGWSVARQGLRDAPRLRVVTSDEIHAVVDRALVLLGIGQDDCERIPSDDQGRLRMEALPELDGRTIVILQAGHVSSGAFDPVGEVCARARDVGAWVHVDGAFGLWAAAAPERAHLTRGCELADSWATDAHKYLNVPYDSGLVICRHRGAIPAAIDLDAPYLNRTEARDGSRYGIALSRRSRVVEIWAALKTLGRRGIGEIVERTSRHASRLAAALEAAGFEVLNRVVLNQVLVALGSDEETAACAARLQTDGTCWCGTTTWKGRTAIRISVCSWATDERDVDLTIDAFRRAMLSGA